MSTWEGKPSIDSCIGDSPAASVAILSLIATAMPLAVASVMSPSASG